MINITTTPTAITPTGGQSARAKHKKPFGIPIRPRTSLIER